MELERTVSSLSSDLLASREAEEALRGQLAQLQVLPDQVQNLMKQVLVPDLLLSHIHASVSRRWVRVKLLLELQLEQTEEIKSSFEEKQNEMQQLLEELEERLADSESSRRTEEEISKELQQQVKSVFFGLLEELRSC